MTTTEYRHIVIDERGTARIAGSRIKVKAIAANHRRGQSAEQIAEAFPHLSPAQVHSALAYYYDHRAEIDAQIERDDREYERLRADSIARGAQPTRAELEQRLAGKRRPMGLAEGQVSIAPEFFDPLPDLEAAVYGDDTDQPPPCAHS